MEQDTFVTPKEIREKYHVSYTTLQRWERQGKIVCRRTPGGIRRYNLNEIGTAFGEPGKGVALKTSIATHHHRCFNANTTVSIDIAMSEIKKVTDSLVLLLRNAAEQGSVDVDEVSCSAIALSRAYNTVARARDDFIVLRKDLEVTETRIKELEGRQEHKLTFPQT